VKVKVGHLGTIVANLEAIRITRVSGSGWAGFCEHLAGPLLTFFFFELKRCFSVLICGVLFYFFLFCVTRALNFFLKSCVNNAAFDRVFDVSVFSFNKVL
jgi:hypothetical protein